MPALDIRRTAYLRTQRQVPKIINIFIVHTDDMSDRPCRVLMVPHFALNLRRSSEPYTNICFVESMGISLRISIPGYSHEYLIMCTTRSCWWQFKGQCYLFWRVCPWLRGEWGSYFVNERLRLRSNIQVRLPDVTVMSNPVSGIWKMPRLVLTSSSVSVQRQWTYSHNWHTKISMVIEIVLHSMPVLLLPTLQHERGSNIVVYKL